MPAKNAGLLPAACALLALATSSSAGCGGTRTRSEQQPAAVPAATPGAIASPAESVPAGRRADIGDSPVGTPRGSVALLVTRDMSRPGPGIGFVAGLPPGPHRGRFTAVVYLRITLPIGRLGPMSIYTRRSFEHQVPDADGHWEVAGEFAKRDVTESVRNDRNISEDLRREVLQAIDRMGPLSAAETIILGGRAIEE
jgi:hypothetical protein